MPGRICWILSACAFKSGTTVLPLILEMPGIARTFIALEDTPSMATLATSVRSGDGCNRERSISKIHAFSVQSVLVLSVYAKDSLEDGKLMCYTYVISTLILSGVRWSDNPRGD